MSAQTERPVPRHHDGPSVVALPEGFRDHEQIMALDAVVRALADLLPAGPEDDLAAIHDAEREAYLAARLGHNRAMREQLVLIAAKAVHALARLG